MNLANLDLNLLRVFDAIHRERNVTRAAERIGLSQPAVSNALTRLRERLDDPLFVRGPQGMTPTPRADELAEPIRSALATLADALDPPRFDPATARRGFRIVTNDYIGATLIPPLMARLRREAPGVDLRLAPPGADTFERLDAQEADLAVAAFGATPERFALEPLTHDSYVVLMRPDHPLAAAPELTLDAFAAAGHALVSPRGDDRGFVDDALAAKGRTRRIVLVVNQFAVAPAVLAETDLLLTLPRRMAALYAARHGLACRPPPVALDAPFGRASMLWRSAFGAHPAHRWLRAALKEVADAIDTG